MRSSALDVDVLIVGAGIAGVTTAWALLQAGIRSIVLEAQDRIGGRIWTSRAWKKLPVDMGAGWVSHLSINPLVELARKKKIALTPSNLGNLSISDAKGHGFSKDETDALFGLYGLVYARVKLAAANRRSAGRDDIALSKVIPGILDEMELDIETRRGIEFLINLTITEAGCRGPERPLALQLGR